MAASRSMKKSPLTPSTLTPPSLNRHHSYTSSPTHADATKILSQVASRAASPRRSNSTGPPNPVSPASPGEVPDRRRSWEDCASQRDGYISFPDFDMLREERGK